MSGKVLFLYFIAAVAAMGGLLFGYDTGVINVALPSLEKEFALTPENTGWVVGAVLIGGMVGPLVSSLLSDRIGRKKINLLAAVIFVLGSVVAALASSVSMLIVGRLLLGLGVGIVSSSVPLYLAEIAPARIRGQLVTFFQLAITMGILLSYVCGFWFAESADGWRSMFWAGFVPAAVLFVGLLFIPESPRWLMKKGRLAEAQTVLARIHEPENVQAEYNEMTENLEREKNDRGDWRELFSKRLRIPFLIGIGIFFLQQFSGINAVIYYSTKIFSMAGFNSATTSTLATVGVGVVNMLSTLIAVRYLDRWGRKPTLYVGLIGIAASLATIAFAFYFKDSLGQDLLRMLAVGGVYVYIVFFALSLGPLGWLLISEVYPLKIRGFAAAMGSFYHWIFDFCVTYTFPIMAATALGENGGIFMIYLSVMLLGLLFARFIVFETKGMSLEDIEKKWQ